MRSTGSVNQVNQWILGYATGANEVARLLTSKNYLGALPPTAIYARVAEYCRANPKVRIQTAAEEFLTYLNGRGASASAGPPNPPADSRRVASRRPTRPRAQRARVGSVRMRGPGLHAPG